jgi:hypothetical protein
MINAQEQNLAMRFGYCAEVTHKKPGPPGLEDGAFPTNQLGAGAGLQELGFRSAGRGGQRPLAPVRS